MSFRIAFFSVLLFLASCQSQYGPMNSMGGYSELQLSPTMWEITAAGNGYTSRERVEAFAMMRAAEITKGQGYSRFVIRKNSISSSTSSFSVGGGRLNSTVVGNQVFSTYTPPQTVNVSKAYGKILIELVNQDGPDFAIGVEPDLIIKQFGPALR